MTKQDCIRELLMQYQEQRSRNDLELDKRIAEVGKIDPEILHMKEENMRLAFDTMRRIMSTQSQEERVCFAEQMKQRGVFNNKEIRRKLISLGLPDNYLDLQYRCNICRDTGYVGDAPARFCDCFENQLRKMQYEKGSLSGAEIQSFNSFDISRFPVDFRDHMNGVRQYCEEYANMFPDGRHLNIVLTGQTGVGKTFLLNCIYERVVSRGFSAIRVSAFRMFEAMRKQHFSNNGNEQDFEQLLEVPLLLIDDLGSEPMMRNITKEYLLILLNERIAARKHTVITTNISLDRIKDIYDERIYSRLADRSRSVAMNLMGKDLRLL